MEETYKVEVYDREGKVVLDTHVGKFVFPPGHAIDIAKGFLHAAEACGVKVKVQAELHPITELQRAALVSRCAIVIRSEERRVGKECRL